jgi:ribosomal protein L9
LAVAADEKGMAVKNQADAKEAAEKEQLQKLADSLAKTVFEFSVKTGEHKEVFGSISRRDIEDALKAKGFTSGQLLLEHPIKSTGEHKVEILFGKGVKGIAKVVVKAQAS